MNSRENAFLILENSEKEKLFVNLALKNMLKCEDKREKAFVTEIVYGVMRYRSRLDYAIGCFCDVKNSKVKNILRVGVYQLLYMSKVPASAACSETVKLCKKYAKNFCGMTNAVMRKISTVKIDFPDTVEMEYSFPSEIVDTIKRSVGNEALASVLKALNTNKGLSARVNKLKASEEEFEKILEERNIEYEKNEDCYRIKKAGDSLNEAFEKGIFTWQGAASVKTAKLLNPHKGERILDLCAAPGGKSCMMAQLMENEGEIIACDLHEHRTHLIENTAKRLGVKIITARCNDASVYNDDLGTFDKVLADVPCSGLGIIAKKPDIKWAKHDFDSLAALQYKILKNAVSYTNDNGYIVYSTCTVNKTENENVVKRLLNENKNIVMDSDFITIYPDDFNDGFFMCRLRKVNNG